MADLVDNYIVAPRVALANGDREMISMLKMVHRKNLLQPIQTLKERGKVYIHIRIHMYLQQPNICYRIGKYRLKNCVIYFLIIYILYLLVRLSTRISFTCVCVCVDISLVRVNICFQFQYFLRCY